MRNLRKDRSGGILSSMAFLIVLFVLASAASVLFPHTWQELTRLADAIWADASHWFDVVWTALQSFFRRLFGIA